MKTAKQRRKRTRHQQKTAEALAYIQHLNNVSQENSKEVFKKYGLKNPLSKNHDN